MELRMSKCIDTSQESKELLSIFLVSILSILIHCLIKMKMDLKAIWNNSHLYYFHLHIYSVTKNEYERIQFNRKSIKNYLITDLISDKDLKSRKVVFFFCGLNFVFNFDGSSLIVFSSCLWFLIMNSFFSKNSDSYVIILLLFFLLWLLDYKLLILDRYRRLIGCSETTDYQL